MDKDSAHCLFVMSWGREGVGGVNQVVNNLCKHLQHDEKVTVSLLIRDWNADSVIHEESDDVHVYRFNVPDIFRQEPRRMPELKNILKFVSRLYPIYSFIKANKITVVNLHYPSSYALAFAILKYTGVLKGLILSFHGAEFVELSNKEFNKFGIWDFIFSNANEIVACSENFASQIRKVIPKYRDKISSIHNGVDTKLLSLVKRENKVKKNNCITILSVGTFEYKKGHDVLIKAFKNILNLNVFLKLIIIGRKTPYLETLEKLRDDLSLGRELTFICNLKHEEVLEYYTMADIFVLPSRIEPFGIVCLEAGYYCLPVLASNVGGIPEYINHQVNGYLCPPDNVESLTNELLSLINDDDVRQRLGNQLHKDVLEHYNWEIGAQKYKDMIMRTM